MVSQNIFNNLHVILCSWNSAIEKVVFTFEAMHCVKSVQIRSIFWSVFSKIRTEYGEILRISPYSVRIRENTDQKILRFGHFSHSDVYMQSKLPEVVFQSSLITIIAHLSIF